MTIAEESVLAALVRMSDDARQNLKLRDLARQANIHHKTCSTCIRSLAEREYIVAMRPHHRGNVCYSFRVLPKAARKLALLGLVADE